MPKQKKILLVTHQADQYNTNIVERHLITSGADVIRFDTDSFLRESRLRYEVGAAGVCTYFLLNGRKIELKEIEAVWMRKIWSPDVINHVHDGFKDSVIAEIRSSFYSFFTQLEKSAYCMNKWTAELAVERNKSWQLAMAQKAGLTIPETLISSDFEEVSHFFDRIGGQMITKLHNSLQFGMDQSDQFFPTTKLVSEDLPTMKGTLEICPMIFQQEIPKAFELRIAYVDGICFCGKIDAKQSKTGKTDWRNAQPGEIDWTLHELPETIENKLKNLMHLLDLVFGVIDFIVTPDDQYVFLEVNPSGEWGMLEQKLELPIGAAIAHSLLEKKGGNEE